MSTQPQIPPKKNVWVLAARPQTLPAAISPVLIGTALAISHNEFHWLAALLALICALLIQIATNFANDYQDFKKGSDREDRLGPIRVTSAGLLPPEKVQAATYLTFALAFIAGIYLMYIGGWPIIVIGILSILSGLAYTGGPYPIGYNGLGDLFVFLFFGLAAVCGTYYVQALHWSAESVLAACVPGLFSIGILVTNNHRDYSQDIISGKKTLAVKLGLKASAIQYKLCMIIPFFIPLIQFLVFDTKPTVFLPLITLPLMIKQLKKFATAEGREYNLVLAGTGKLLFIFSILYSVGISLQLLIK